MSGQLSTSSEAESFEQGSQHPTLDVTRFRRALASIHEQVAGGHGRVEVKRKGCDDVCVMISKAELEAMERALEILAGCSEYKSMCDALSKLVSDCDGNCGQSQA